MDKKQLIPTFYNLIAVLATFIMLMKLYPKVLAGIVVVLFLFYLSKVWSAR